VTYFKSDTRVEFGKAQRVADLKSMTTLRGQVQKGFGAGSANLRTQLPLIAKEFPWVGDYHCGTINVRLENGLLVLAPDHRTRRIDWAPEHAPGEVFDLLRIEFESRGKMCPACLYIAHNSDHRRDLRIHEIIAPKIEVSVDEHCEIHLHQRCILLPYRQNPLAVVL
jgi:hypothetical protein